MKAGLATEVALVQDIATLAATDIDAFRNAVLALADWASDEQVWVNNQAPPSCLAEAINTYRLGLSDLTLGAITLTALVADTSTPEELEPALRQIGEGHIAISDAALAAEVASCDDGATTPSPSAIDLASAYMNLADTTNVAIRDFDAQGEQDARTRARKLLEIERSSADAIERWPDEAGVLDDLKASMGLAIQLLSDGAASTSPADATSRLNLAMLTIREEGFIEDVSQREAAASLRRVLNLPDMGEEDVL